MCLERVRWSERTAAWRYAMARAYATGLPCQATSPTAEADAHRLARFMCDGWRSLVSDVGLADAGAVSASLPRSFDHLRRSHVPRSGAHVVGAPRWARPWSSME